MNRFLNYIFGLDSKMLSALYAIHLYVQKCILILDDQILELHFCLGRDMLSAFYASDICVRKRICGQFLNSV